MSAVRLVGVTKRRTSRAVVDRVSLEVAEGAFVGLLGSSGSGKTTILRMIAGLEVPDEGQIWIGSDLVAENGRNLLPPRARRIGFVFQDLALWPHMTVRESIDFVLESTGVPKARRPERILEAVRLARIEEHCDRHPDQLSGGEQQRAALARALATSPRLLLLDEPMSSLDRDLKVELAAELGALQSRLQVTTIYVTHDLSEINGVAQHLILLRNGCIHATEEIKRSVG
jgi:ABC-type sugar transport system ATPase subunit